MFLRAIALLVLLFVTMAQQMDFFEHQQSNSAARNTAGNSNSRPNTGKFVVSNQRPAKVIQFAKSRRSDLRNCNVQRVERRGSDFRITFKCQGNRVVRVTILVDRRTKRMTMKPSPSRPRPSTKKYA